jgi:hypothetical protein
VLGRVLRRRGAADAADVLQAEQDHRDVVAAARRVRRVDQRPPGVRQGARAREQLADARLGDHRRQAVAADEVHVAVARRPRVRVGLDRRLRAERARDDRALRVVVGLLRRELALAHELLDERVVVGQTLEVAVAQAVEAAVADVGDRDLVLAHVGERHRRAHPGALVVRARQRVDARVGLLDELAQPLLDAAAAVG